MAKFNYKITCKSCDFTTNVSQEADLLFFNTRVDKFGLSFDAPSLHDCAVRKAMFEHHEKTRETEEERRGHMPFEVVLLGKRETVDLEVRDFRVLKDIPFKEAYAQVRAEAKKRGIEL